MTFLERIFGGRKQRARMEPLYRAVVAEARDPDWYRNGGVPDTVDGRFDMLAAAMALALLRFEGEGEAARELSILLTETFIDDMEASLRQIGTGDYVVGKHVGRLMGALGGRLAAFRAAIAEGADFEAPARRNIFHDSPPSEEALRHVAQRLEAFHARLAAAATAELLEGRL